MMFDVVVDTGQSRWPNAQYGMMELGDHMENGDGEGASERARCHECHPLGHFYKHPTCIAWHTKVGTDEERDLRLAAGELAAVDSKLGLVM